MLLLVVSHFRKNRQTVKLTPGSSGCPYQVDIQVFRSFRPNRPHISSSMHNNVKQQGNKTTPTASNLLDAVKADASRLSPREPFPAPRQKPYLVIASEPVKNFLNFFFSAPSGPPRPLPAFPPVRFGEPVSRGSAQKAQ